MKIFIYTFSGTGNTYIASNFIAESLKGSGAEVIAYKIEGEDLESIPLNFGEGDYIIIGYPIYAFNVPRIVRDFIKLLPKSNGNKFAIFKTGGEPFIFNRTSSLKTVNQLSKKGYEFMFEQLFLMPYNILFRYHDSLAKQMYINTHDLSKEFANKVMGGYRKSISRNIISRIVSFIMQIQWSGARLNGRLYTCNMKKCTMCMKCVRECPVDNIYKADSRIKFGGKCLMCMRCSMHCPTKAINIGLMNIFAVKGGYDFKRILRDESIDPSYINEETKGYFKLFRKYFGKL